MSLYGEKFKIGGLSCGLVALRGCCQTGSTGWCSSGSTHPWSRSRPWSGTRPSLRGRASCPRATASTVRISSTAPPPAAYHVVLQVGKQYLGDVTGYQAQVTEAPGDHPGAGGDHPDPAGHHRGEGEHHRPAGGDHRDSDGHD